MKTSELMAGSSITFPEFTGERVYMVEFKPGEALPVGLERWQRTVDQMLRGIHATGNAFLMVDQAHVAAGATHRRPGLHVDGYWYPGVSGHKHVFRAAEHGGHGTVGPREALIIAASVEGCEAFEGSWEGSAGTGGDCSHIDARSLARRRMVPGVAWFGETGSLLHSALELPASAARTVVRLNVHGWLS